MKKECPWHVRYIFVSDPTIQCVTCDRCENYSACQGKLYFVLKGIV